MSTVYQHQTDPNFFQRMFKQIRQKITKDDVHSVVTLRYLLDDLVEFNNGCLDVMKSFAYPLAVSNLQRMVRATKHLDTHHDRPYTTINHKPAVTPETVQPNFSFPSILDKLHSAQDALETISKKSETNAVSLDRITFPALMNRLTNDELTREEMAGSIVRYFIRLLFDHGVLLENEENKFMAQFLTRYPDAFTWAYAPSLFGVDTHYGKLTETWRTALKEGFAKAYKPYQLEETEIYKSMLGRNEHVLRELILTSGQTLEQERQIVISMVFRALICTLLGIRITNRNHFLTCLDYQIEECYDTVLESIMDEGLRTCLS